MAIRKKSCCQATISDSMIECYDRAEIWLVQTVSTLSETVEEAPRKKIGKKKHWRTKWIGRNKWVKKKLIA